MTAAQFELLFKQLYAPLCREANRLVRDKDAAEDLVQEVFVRFWNKINSLPENLDAKAYLYKSVRNAALNHLESAKKTIRPDSEVWLNLEHSTKSDGDLLAGEAQVAIAKGIDLLPPACRNVFILSRYEELSYKEIAETLDVSIKTVEAQMSKALRLLREHLLPFLMLFISLFFNRFP
jgi:RNA polymerase sigma-70 factor (ECF subfamily)